MCFYKWLIFVRDTFTEFEENELLIQNYCLILFAHSKDFHTYFLKEIYDIKNKTFSFNYGKWNNDSGLTVTTIPMHVRRFNFNKTEIVLETLGKTNVSYIIIIILFLLLNIYFKNFLQCTREINYRICAHLEILEDFSKLMNFSIVWKPFTMNNIPKILTGDIFYLAIPFQEPRLFRFDRLTPFFKNTWVLKFFTNPKRKK